MKNKNWRRILWACVAVAALAVAFWAHRTRGSRYLDSLGITVPASAVTNYQKGPFTLTGDEYLIAFQLPPAQIPALIKRMQIKDRYETGPYARVMSGA